MTGLKFSHDHEWVKISGNTAYVGISDYAQNAMGDIVYVDLPQVGQMVTAGGEAGTLESVKAVSELYSPVSGVIKDVNAALNEAPELLNEAPYDNWILLIELDNPGEADALMDEAEYEAFCEKEA